MKIPKLLAPALAGLLLMPLAPAVAGAAETLQWKPCKDIAANWPADDTRSECTSFKVPVDYARPDGRQLDLAVSRIKASGSRTGALLLNPGGPGGSGMIMPAEILKAKIGGIGVHHDLIGFAPRGVSYSDALSCTHDPAQPDPSWPAKERARFVSDQNAKRYQACVAKDPAYVRNLTTANIARDMDRIRQALGEDKISYFGMSWGSALGAEYRTQFDAHVDRMLLDSVMNPVFDLRAMDRDDAAARETLFHDFARWIAGNDRIYRFGRSPAQVAQALLALRATTKNTDQVDALLTGGRATWPESARQLVALRSGAPISVPAAKSSSGFDWTDPNLLSNSDQQDALLCNESTSSRDFETNWRNRIALAKQFPVSGMHGKFDGHCTGWPLPPVKWQFTKGKSQLQLVAHAYETTTPYQWAWDMRARIGGSVLTVLDDEHASFADLPCAAKAVEFFDTGKTSDSVCPGNPIPPAS